MFDAYNELKIAIADDTWFFVFVLRYDATYAFRKNEQQTWI